jgi:hypothetical protein
MERPMGGKKAGSKRSASGHWEEHPLNKFRRLRPVYKQGMRADEPPFELEPPLPDIWVEDPPAREPKEWLADELKRMKAAGERVSSERGIAKILVARMPEAVRRGEVTRALSEGRIRNLLTELR